MRVLFPKLDFFYNLEPWLILLDQLKDRFDIVVPSYDPEFISFIEGKGAQGFWLGDSFKSPIHVKPAGLQSTLDDFFIQRFYKRLAQHMLSQVKPDVVLVSGDFRGFEYFVCKYAPYSMVIEITVYAYMPEDYVTYVNVLQSKWAHIPKRIDCWLERLTGHHILARLGGEPYLPHGMQLWKTLASYLGGMHYQVFMKGGGTSDMIALNMVVDKYIHEGLGVPASKLVVTGSPLYDFLVSFKAQASQQRRVALKASIDLEPDAPYILFLMPIYKDLRSFNMWGDHFELVNWVLNAILENAPEHIVLIKLHPRNTLDEMHPVTSHPRLRYLDPGRFTTDRQNTELIDASDMVIMNTSSVGISVLALDRLLLTYNLNDNLDGRFFDKLKANRHANNRPDFEKAVHELLYDGNAKEIALQQQRQFVAEHLQLDGKCCDRISLLIETKGQAFVDL